MYVLSSDDIMIVNGELERIWKAVDVTNFMLSSWNSPEGADNKKYENCSQDRKSTIRDPKPRHPKYESGVVICQTASVLFTLKFIYFDIALIDISNFYY
jgi:hypothetical protein